MPRKSLVFVAMGTVMFLLAATSSAQVPSVMNYQGKLTTASGGCLNDTVQMTFTIYADESGTISEWSETQTEVVVKEGIFSVVLGSVNPLPHSLFDGSVKYLGVQVESDPEMTPLKPIVSVAYAFRSAIADSALNVPAAGIVSVDGVSNPGGDVDLIQTDAITITPDDGANTVTFGETHSARTDNPHAVTAAQAGALVSVDGVDNAGGDVDFVAGPNMTITPDNGAKTITFSAQPGAVTDDDWTFRITDTADTTLITGGAWGIARSGNMLYGNADSTHVNLGVACTTGMSGENLRYASVGGGLQNTAGHNYTTVGGGYGNTASNGRATVGGGYFNTASGLGSTVGGGWADTASGYIATVGGGWGNTAAMDQATVGGGWGNTASGMRATVGGGAYNAAIANDATVAGGYADTASGWRSTVGGGEYNTATTDQATVGGGRANTASGYRATVAGGYKNTASATDATVGGGYQNTASLNNATVGGGWDNTASGLSATVPGGRADTAAGDFSLAAGDSVRITSDGDYTFAFGRDFTTSTPNAVIFHNSVDPIKVGIGTSAPAWPFHVATSRSRAGYFTSDSLDDSTHVIHGEFTGSGDADARAFYGYSRPADYYGVGGEFEGGWMGAVGEVFPTGSLVYYGLRGRVMGGSGFNLGASGYAADGQQNYGVWGRAFSGEVAYGVYGDALDATTNWAGYFDGNVNVTGTLSKGGGSFKIDHPLDPENKYLYHSFVESPDMMNVYNGNVVLDAKGEAAVQLPDYFQALNTDFRYQLTAIGAPGPNLYIAEKIAGNQFTIAGGEPGMEVSWQVTGIRHDKFAEANRIQVEVDKPADELGKYLHPQAYGLGEEYDIHYEQHKRMEEARLRGGK